MSIKKSNTVFAISTFLAVILDVVFWIIATQDSVQDSLKRMKEFSNLFLFILAILIYLVVFIISYNLIGKFSKDGSRLFRLYDKHFLLFFGFAVCLNIAFMAIQFLNADQVYASNSYEFIWHQVPFTVLILVLVSFFGIFISMSDRFSLEALDNTKDSKVVFWLLSITIAYIAGLVQYVPDTAAYHLDAYYTSIYNVQHGIPYSYVNGSIYGHYAIFFTPVFALAKLLGAVNMLKVFSLTMSVIVFATYMLIAYSINVLVKNKAIKYLGVCAMAFTLIAMRDADVYFQVHPHRTFIIAITIALITKVVKHPQKIKLYTGIGFVVCTLMIIWNTEIGIFSMLSWMSFLIAMELTKNKQKIRHTWRNIGIVIVLGGLSFVAAWWIVNLYNVIILKGDALSLSQYIYPYMAKTDIIETLSTPLDNMTTSWIFVLFVMLFYLGKGLSSTRLCHRDTALDIKSAALFAIAFLGLASMSYYINRTAYYNLDIILSLVVVLLCVMSQDSLQLVHAVWHKDKRKGLTAWQGLTAGFGISAVFVLFALSFGTIINMGNNWTHRENLKVETSILELVEDVSNNVPKDTPAWGLLVPEIYTMLDWDMQFQCADYPDIYFYPKAKDYIVKKLSSMEDKAFFTSGHTAAYLNTIPENNRNFFRTHYAAKTWIASGSEFLYYLPIKDCKLMYTIPSITLSATTEYDYFIYNKISNIKRNKKYFIRFQVEAKETPSAFFVDFYGDNYDIESSQALFPIDRKIKNYTAVLYSGDMELPKEVYLRIVDRCGSAVEVKNFELFECE